MGLGDELVQFDPRYQRIFSNLLGRTVVAEDMDAAIAMARKYGHRFKIVTLDGQVLNPGGSMTGGSVSRSAGILSRANELERLAEQRKGLEADLKQAPMPPAAGTSSAGSWSRFRPAPPRPRRIPPPPGRALRPWRARPPPCGPRPRARPRARASSRRAPPVSGRPSRS